MISEATIVEAVQNTVPKELLTLSSTLKQKGHRCWIVGGSVRDLLLDLDQGNSPQRRGDWDLATSAHPREVKKLFRKVIPTGIEHGTVTVVLNQEHFEVTTLRGERGHSDGRRPDEVFYVDDLAEDLARRDFTVNAMAVNLEENTFHDPFGGRQDLASRLLRAVGQAAVRFSEDGLRSLRCARFCSTLGFEIEPETKAAIRGSLGTFEKVARERVRDEWFKALRSSTPSRFVRVVRTEGMLEKTIPELWSSTETSARFEEALSRLDASPAEPTLRLALLISLQVAPEDAPFQAEAAALARALSAALKLSRKEQGEIELLTSRAHLPLALLQSPDDEAARRWLSSVGRIHADEVLAFQRLTDLKSDPRLLLAHQKIREQLASECPLSTAELAVNGGDLIQNAFIKKGPAVGQTLSYLLDTALARPEVNTRGEMLRLAQDFTSE